MGLVGVGGDELALAFGAALPAVSLWLIVAGGATYVAGVGFYMWERLRFQNAIWHGFVAVAAGLHFAAVAVAVA